MGLLAPEAHLCNEDNYVARGSLAAARSIISEQRPVLASYLRLHVGDPVEILAGRGFSDACPVWGFGVGGDSCCVANDNGS